VVGKDLQVIQISDMEGKEIVGKFNGCRILAITLKWWMEGQWASFFGYVPIFQLLS
jgi:hypothetical protein